MSCETVQLVETSSSQILLQFGDILSTQQAWLQRETKDLCEISVTNPTASIQKGWGVMEAKSDWKRLVIPSRPQN